MDEALGHGSRRWMERLETGNLQKPHLFPPNDATITLECGRIREYRITHIALQHSLHGQMVTDVSCNGELVAFAVDEMIDVPYDDPRSEAEIEELQRVEVDYFFYRGSGEFRRVVRTDHGVDPPQVTTTEDSVPIGDHDQRAAALRTACDSQRGRRYPPGLDLIDVGPR